MFNYPSLYGSPADNFHSSESQDSNTRAQERTYDEKLVEEGVAAFLPTILGNSDKKIYGPHVVRLNNYAKHDFTKDAFKWLRSVLHVYTDCVLAAELGRADYLVFRAICARTVSFGKLAERLTIEQLCHGYRDEAGEFKINPTTLLPLFMGCGVKETTAKASLKSLVTMGLVSSLETAWRASPNSVPVPVRYLAPLPVRFAMETILGRTLRGNEHVPTSDQRHEILRALNLAGSGFRCAAREVWEKGPLARLSDLPAVRGALDALQHSVDISGLPAAVTIAHGSATDRSGVGK